MITEITIIITAYLLGSLPFSYIVAKLLKDIDIRKHGTKNPGTSNVFLTVGPIAGILTLILDIAKGTLAVLIAQQSSMPDLIIIIAAFAAILGHCFPIFLKFRGGKGMAVAIGVLIPLAPLELLIALIILIILSLIIKRLILSLLIAFTLIPILAFYFNKPLTIVIGILIIVIARWIIDARDSKRLLSKSHHKKLKSKLGGK